MPGMRAALLAMLVPATLAADSVLFLDNGKGGYLRSQLSPMELSAESNAAALAALASIRPSQDVDKATSDQVDALLTPDVFERPMAVLSIQLVGVTEEGLGAFKFPFASLGAPVSGGSTAVAAALSRLAASQLARCEAACDSECLSSALSGFEGFGALAQHDAPSHAFLKETACFLRAAAQPARGLVVARLSGLHHVASAHGAASPEAAAAARLLAQATAAAVQAFYEAAGGAAAAQLIALEAPPMAALPSDAQPAELSAEQRRRKLVKNAVATNQQRNINVWQSHVAAYGTGILVFVVAASGIICLCAMPTGEDTLLYAKTKSD